MVRTEYKNFTAYPSVDHIHCASEPGYYKGILYSMQDKQGLLIIMCKPLHFKYNPEGQFGWCGHMFVYGKMRRYLFD